MRQWAFQALVNVRNFDSIERRNLAGEIVLKLMFISIFVYSTLVQAKDPVPSKDEADFTIRKSMCFSPKLFFGNKAELKKNLSDSVTTALRLEGVGSLSELALKARTQKIRYASRTVLGGAIYLAAITENRSAFVDLVQFETNLCKAQKESGQNGCDRFIKALANQDAFQKTALDQYEFIQQEKNQFSQGEVPMAAKKETKSPSEMLALMKWGDEGPAPQGQKSSSPKDLDSSLKELSLGFQEAIRPGKNDRLDNCERKVAGALKDRFQNYDPAKSVIVAPTNPIFQDPVR